jgi:Tol biopolymer transport system component
LWVFNESAKKPVRLTAGQLMLSEPVPSRDGKKLFALGALQRVEFVRYDSRSAVFTPSLSGISADALAFSRDGAWIAYTAYPDHTLWRSRADGSNREQLTFPSNATQMPRWSPDGKRIAFMSRPADGRWKIYTIDASGGPAEQLTPGDQEAGNPTWSPDGRALVFAETPWVHGFAPHSSAIHLLDLKTRQIETLPNSDGLWAPRWSYDGKFLVAETLDSRNLVIYEFSTRKWKPLASSGEEMIGYSSWSSDSRFVYYNTYSSGPGKIFRVSVAARRPELVAALKDLSEAESLGRFFTLTPDDTPILVRDTSITEVYSLSLQLP